jgi:hypothetical protein
MLAGVDQCPWTAGVPAVAAPGALVIDAPTAALLPVGLPLAIVVPFHTQALPFQTLAGLVTHAEPDHTFVGLVTHALPDQTLTGLPPPPAEATGFSASSHEVHCEPDAEPDV